MIGPLEATAVGGALALGLRHGVDWDHLAALSDLTGSQRRPRRSMWLATSYALGHACTVLVLGAIAIVFTERVPTSVDRVLERVTGLSLIALGAWMAWMVWCTRGVPPLRSRWMLLIDAARRMAGRAGGARRRVVIEHSHPHDHHHPMHEHPHTDPTASVAASGHRQVVTAPVAVVHSHTHRHVALVPRDPFTTYGSWSSFGVGVLHGVGAETPTQLMAFAAAAQAGGRAASLGLLAAFVVGLVVANTAVAAASTLGFRSVLGHPVVSGTVAGLVAGLSLLVGTLLVAGHPAALPVLGG